MNNRERDKPVEMYDLFVALRRKKENRELKEICFRQIIRDEKIDLEILKAKIKMIPGIWRIYKTVNKRKIIPARKLLMKHLIDNPEHFEYRIDSLWKNCLLKKECKGERKFLIDIDKDLSEDKVLKIIFSINLKVEEVIKTPNGWHVIVEELDTRKITEDFIEVKRDAIKFVEILENDS